MLDARAFACDGQPLLSVLTVDEVRHVYSALHCVIAVRAKCRWRRVGLAAKQALAALPHPSMQTSAPAPLSLQPPSAWPVCPLHPLINIELVCRCDGRGAARVAQGRCTRAGPAAALTRPTRHCRRRGARLPWMLGIDCSRGACCWCGEATNMRCWWHSSPRAPRPCSCSTSNTQPSKARCLHQIYSISKSLMCYSGDYCGQR